MRRDGRLTTAITSTPASVSHGRWSKSTDYTLPTGNNSRKRFACGKSVPKREALKSNWLRSSNRQPNSTIVRVSKNTEPCFPPIIYVWRKLREKYTESLTTGWSILSRMKMAKNMEIHSSPRSLGNLSDMKPCKTDSRLPKKS